MFYMKANSVICTDQNISVDKTKYQVLKAIVFFLFFLFIIFSHKICAQQTFWLAITYFFFFFFFQPVKQDNSLTSITNDFVFTLYRSTVSLKNPLLHSYRQLLEHFMEQLFRSQHLLLAYSWTDKPQTSVLKTRKDVNYCLNTKLNLCSTKC